MLSDKALKLLAWLAKEGDEDGYPRELVCEGRAWVAGLNRVNGKIARELLMYCAISEDDGGGGGEKMQRYYINQTGREILADPEKGCRRIQELLSGKIKE